MSTTKIEWATDVWNPVTGCTPVSQGCEHCYARRMAQRQRGRNGYPETEPFSVRFHADRLTQPLHWETPRRIFVCSMADLFHESLTFEQIGAVYGIMTAAQQHTFMVLTKRPERALQFYRFAQDTQFSNPWSRCWVWAMERAGIGDIRPWTGARQWPLPNVWIGTSAEDQAALNCRTPWILQIPAKVRFLSMEPLLGPVKGSFLRDWIQYGQFRLMGMSVQQLPRHCTMKPFSCIHWVIAGGETGPGARPMHPKWIRTVRDQCQAAQVPFFFKGSGQWAPSANPTHFVCEKGHWDRINADRIDKHRDGDLCMASTMGIRRMRQRDHEAILDGVQHRQLPEGQ